MNTNYDVEATRYQGVEDEATQHEESSTVEQSIPKEQPNLDVTSNNDVQGTAAKNNGWKRAAVEAGSGLLIGGVATAFMGMKIADPDLTAGEQGNEHHQDDLSAPQWVDDRMLLSTSVNDDMSFVEAFESARAEVGPGGCFEWHGNVYGTYSSDEWDQMTASQRAEWSDHFNWNHINHSSSNVAQHSTTAHDSITAHSGHIAQADTTEINDADIEVVSVNLDNNQTDMVQNTNHIEEPDIEAAAVEVSQVDVTTDEPEIEILGVVHDNETGVNIGGMMVDNQEVILIDVDGDLAFDYMASDLNHNGEVDQNEVVDIQDQNLTVNDFGGFTDPTGDMMTSEDTPDYTTDIDEG